MFIPQSLRLLQRRPRTRNNAAVRRPLNHRHRFFGTTAPTLANVCNHPPSFPSSPSSPSRPPSSGQVDVNGVVKMLNETVLAQRREMEAKMKAQEVEMERTMEDVVTFVKRICFVVVCVLVYVVMLRIEMWKLKRGEGKGGRGEKKEKGEGR